MLCQELPFTREIRAFGKPPGKPVLTVHSATLGLHTPQNVSSDWQSGSPHLSLSWFMSHCPRWIQGVCLRMVAGVVEIPKCFPIYWEQPRSLIPTSPSPQLPQAPTDAPWLSWFARSAIINTTEWVAYTTGDCFLIVLQVTSVRPKPQKGWIPPWLAGGHPLTVPSQGLLSRCIPGVSLYILMSL